MEVKCQAAEETKNTEAENKAAEMEIEAKRQVVETRKRPKKPWRKRKRKVQPRKPGAKEPLLVGCCRFFPVSLVGAIVDNCSIGCRTIVEIDDKGG
jgi:hypothetical protein